MKRFLFLVLCCGFAATIGAQSWPDVKNEAKAGARWWWLGSAVDKENLQWNLKQYADHGIGSLEITPIYGVQGNQANNIPYLSDKWMEMLRETQKYGCFAVSSCFISTIRTLDVLILPLLNSTSSAIVIPKT